MGTKEQEKKADAVEAKFERPKTLAGKLAGILGEIGRVAKRGYNQHFKYEYVTEADLADEIRPLMAKYNVAVIPSVVSTSVEANNVTIVQMTFTVIDGDTGEKETSSFFGAGQDKADKGIYKAITGAMKYWMYKTFVISTGDDPEVDNDSDKQQPGVQSRPGNGNGQTKQGQQGQQYDEEQQRRDYARYESDAVLIAAFRTPLEIDQFMTRNKAAIDANMYRQYYHDLADSTKAQAQSN